ADDPNPLRLAVPRQPDPAGNLRQRIGHDPSGSVGRLGHPGQVAAPLLPATRPATARAAYATSRAPRHLKRQSLAPGQTGKLLARRLRRVPLELGEQSTQLAQAPDHVQTRAVPVSLDEF